MSPREIEVAKALGACTFLPGSWNKRFAKDIKWLAEHTPEKELTPRQSANLVRLAWRYRRQMPAHLAYPATEEELQR